MRILVPFVFLALQCVAAIAPVRDVESQISVGANQPLPGFYGGYAFFVQRPDFVKLYSPDGTLVLAMPVATEMHASVISVAVDSDGTIAVGFTSKGLGGIELLDTRGNKLGSFSTGNYLPTHIAFVDDHSIWTFGWEMHSHDPTLNTPEYMSLRHYARSGVQIGAYLPRSLFPKGLEPACDNWQRQSMYVANDRIGVLACSGMTSANPEWIELDFQGNLIGRWHVGSSHTRVALARDGHVYVQDTVNGSHQVFTLNRDSSTFEPVSWTIPGEMYGAVGDQLVFADYSTGTMHFRWYTQP